MDSNAFISFDESAIINPVEVADRKWAEFAEKNPDLAKMQRYSDQRDFMFMKPEVYEEEMEKRRERKAVVK